MGLTVQLLIEGLDVDRIGRSRHADENRQGNQNGYDGLHSYFSKQCRQHHVASHRRATDRTALLRRAVSGGTTFEDIWYCCASLGIPLRCAHVDQSPDARAAGALSAALFTDGHEVVLAWRVETPDGGLADLTRFDPNKLGQSDRALYFLRRFMAWEPAQALVMTAETWLAGATPGRGSRETAVVV